MIQGFSTPSARNKNGIFMILMRWNLYAYRVVNIISQVEKEREMQKKNIAVNFKKL